MANQLTLLNYDENGEKIEWICECALCKLLALPIFRRFVGTDREGGGKVSEEISPIVIQQPTSSSVTVESSSQNIDVDSIVSKVVNEVDKRISSRIDGVERELEDVKNNFSGVAEELRNAIIEVRSAISELANPFNFMRKYAEIVDDSGKLLQLLGQQNTQSASSQQVSPNLLTSIASQLPLNEDIKMLLSSILMQQRTSSSQKPSYFAKILRLIKWIDEHLTGLPREVINELTDFAVVSGLIGEKERNLLLSAINFVENMRKRGIRVREQLIMFYTVVKMLGIEDREADSEILKIIIEESKYGQPDGVRNGL